MAADDTDSLAVWGRRKRAYVVPDKKFVFISVAKNACTSLKWAVAELAGEDLDSFSNRLSSGITADDAIHVRAQWQRTPMLGDLDPEVRKQIHPDNGWFVFAVVRDPRSRVFSAWENKFLMRNPKFQYLADADWYPRVPRHADDVVEDFERFVDAMLADPDHELHADSHFSPQVKLLSEHEIEYSRIYEIGEMKQLVADWEAHLASVGHPTTLTLRHSNDTPLAANAVAFRGGLREKCERLYAADFERFPDLWDFSRIERKPDWSDAQLDQVRQAAATGERIGELRDLAARQRETIKELRGQLAETERKVRRARRRARRAEDKLEAAESPTGLLGRLRSRV